MDCVAIISGSLFFALSLSLPFLFCALSICHCRLCFVCNRHTVPLSLFPRLSSGGIHILFLSFFVFVPLIIVIFRQSLVDLCFLSVSSACCSAMPVFGFPLPLWCCSSSHPSWCPRVPALVHTPLCLFLMNRFVSLIYLRAISASIIHLFDQFY